MLYEVEDFWDAVEYPRVGKQTLKLVDNKPDIAHQFQKWLLPKSFDLGLYRFDQDPH